MYKIVKLISFSYLSCLLLSSCGEYPCGKASLHIALIDFAETESDTVIVRRFLKSKNFIALYDTTLINAANNTFGYLTDTFHINYS